MKNYFFPHLTGTIFIIWVKLARPLYLPFKDGGYGEVEEKKKYLVLDNR
jgi:hypothetical protein